MKRPTNLNIIDTLFLFAVSEWAKDLVGKSAPVAYGELLSVLGENRPKLGFQAAEVTFAVAAIDPVSESQKRFLDALSRMRISVEGVDYRHAYVSSPRIGARDHGEQPVSTLAPHLCYALGLLAGRESPEVIVVTGSFQLYSPLMDFATKRGGRAAIAFFRRFLDPRWAQVGLFEPKSPIKWLELDPFTHRLLGVDLPTEASSEYLGSRGLANI